MVGNHDHRALAEDFYQLAKLLVQMGEPVYAWTLAPDEIRYDVGNFESYFRAFVDFALADERFGYLTRKYVKSKAYEL